MKTISRIWGSAANDSNTATEWHARLTAHWVSRLIGEEKDPCGQWATLGASSTGVGAVQVAGGRPVTVVVDGLLLGLMSPASPADYILQRYLELGFLPALEGLHGDFSIAVLDGRSGELWLARDRLGVRPLYYASLPGGLVFSSQPLALTEVPGVGRSVNRRFVGLFAASHYRTFDNLQSDSPYENVRQLPAGHWLHWKSGKMRTGAYWKLEAAPDHQLTEEEFTARYRELLLDAVGDRLAHAPRRAFSLSGGMDSSSVLSCGVYLTGEKQTAFSTVYDDRTYDESEDIRTILDATVANWHQVDVSNPDVFELIGKMIAVNDEPVATATWLSHFQLCKRASEAGFSNLFTGLGGDELNAGEYEHFFFFFADILRSGDSDKLSKEVELWARYHNHPLYQKNRAVADEGINRMTDAGHPGRCLPDRNRLMKYSAALNREYFDLTTFEPVMDCLFDSYLKNRTYQDIFRETAPCCLRAQDRHGAKFGLAHLNPFYDHRLVEFMFRVPGTLKVRDGVTKHLLREAMRGIVPEATRTRVKKTGWNAPAHLWFSGKGGDRLLDTVHSNAFKALGIYNTEEVERIIREHQRIVAGNRIEENHMMFLWQLANLQAWMHLQ